MRCLLLHSRLRLLFIFLFHCNSGQICCSESPCCFHCLQSYGSRTMTCVFRPIFPAFSAAWALWSCEIAFYHLWPFPLFVSGGHYCSIAVMFSKYWIQRCGEAPIACAGAHSYTPRCVCTDCIRAFCSHQGICLISRNQCCAGLWVIILKHLKNTFYVWVEFSWAKSYVFMTVIFP